MCHDNVNTIVMDDLADWSKSKNTMTLHSEIDLTFFVTHNCHQMETQTS